MVFAGVEAGEVDVGPSFAFVAAEESVLGGGELIIPKGVNKGIVALAPD